MELIQKNNIYDSILKSAEKSILHKCRQIVKTMQNAMLNRWFELFLSKRIMPAFLKIGFNEPSVSLVFKMAEPSWETMGLL